MIHNENNLPHMLLAPADVGGGAGGTPSEANQPFVVNPRGPIPRNMVREHIAFGDGRELSVQGSPELTARVTDAFYGREPRVQPTLPPEPPPQRGAPSPPTRPATVRSTVQERTTTTPAATGQPTTTETVEEELVREPLPRPPRTRWRQRFAPVRERLVEIRERGRYSTSNMIAAGILGALLGAGAVGLAWAVQANTPPDTSITRITIPIGQCRDVPGNSIALGYFMSVNGTVYNPEKDPKEGVVVALNSPAKICTDPTDKQATLVEVVGDGQNSLYARFAQDISKMQDEGCIANNGCRRVITATR